MLTSLRRSLLDTSKKYLLRDLFQGDAAAGTLNGTPASGGPGTRTVTDTENKLSVVGGVLSLAGGMASPAWGNPGMIYGAVTRVGGRVLLANFNVASEQIRVGWEVAARLLFVQDGVWTINTQLYVLAFDNSVLSGVISQSVNYAAAVVLRTAGSFVFLKGGAFAYWTLLWSEATATNALVPMISNYNAVSSADNIRIPTKLWLPSPLASDGFSEAATDGLGHTEQNGGNGLAWTGATWTVAAGAVTNSPTLGAELDSGNLVVGNWYSITLDTVGSYFYAGSATGNTFQATATTALTAAEKVKQLTLSSLFRSLAVSTPDVLAEAAVILTAGTQGGLVLNLDDTATPANFVIAYHNGTNCLLEKCVAGVYTTVISAAATYSAGAVLRVIKDGTAYRLYYNNALVGTGTISDAGIVSNARHGLFSTYASNSFDNLTVWARGTGNEYSALDTF